MTITPWWEALKIRPEIITSSGAIDDVQMSLFQAVHSTGATRPLYSKASYYGEITFPSGQLVDLLAKVAVRLGASNYQAAPALRRLDQAMGGGKSHACIGCWHLGTTPAELGKTEIGKRVFAAAAEIAGAPLPHDLGNPHVVVLACDNMTPGAPDKHLDGPATSLYERFLWRLFDHDFALYERYQPFFSDKSKIAEALKALNRPVLIIVDEILDYIGNGLDGAAQPDLTGRDMAFMRALLDTVNDVAHVAMIIVMIDSERDTLPLSKDGEARREGLQADISRNGGQPTAVNENADFSAILRRRLFVQPPAVEVARATAKEFSAAMTDRAWKSKVYDVLAPAAPWVSAFPDAVARTYPFHPQLMQLAETEWANMAGFQKVRSTIRVFASAIYALSKRAERGEWVPFLVGPGDLPLSDAQVRSDLLGSGLILDTKTQANYRSIAQSDIISLDDSSGAARQLDLHRDDALLGDANPRAAERAATMIFLASVVGSRGSGRRGASEAEVKAATIVPSLSYGLAHADSVIKELTETEAGMGTIEILPGKGGQPPRFFLSTSQTLAILIRAARNTVTDTERDSAIARVADELATSGVFKRRLFVRQILGTSPAATLKSAGIDDARTTRLVVLDPAAFSLRNGMEHDTLEAISAITGIGGSQVPVEWAASAIFAVVNTQRRQQARALAVNYLAHEGALSAPEMAHDPEMRRASIAARDDALSALKSKVRSAFQHVVYVSQPEPHMPRTLAVETFDNDLESSLDGTTVWKLLVDKDRAFESDQFSGPILVLNLREEDFGRPLSEIRDAFWSTPRLPLLPRGEEDLRRAIWDAVDRSLLRIVDSLGNTVTVTNPIEINLSQSGLFLARPNAREQIGDDPLPFSVARDTPAIAEGSSPGNGPKSNSPQGSTDIPGVGPGSEKKITFTLAHADSESLAQVFLQLYELEDASSASWVQGTLTVIVEAGKESGLTSALAAMNISASVQDQ